jgi:hypothetical protein
MKCSDARFLLAADPRNGDPALLEHLTGCVTCAAYASDMHELDRQLRGAMNVPVPEVPLPAGPYSVAGGSDTASRKPSRRFAPQLALAASIAGIALVAGLLWTAFPRQSLASAVVAHMAHEPDAWRTNTPLPTGDIQHVISRSGVRLDAMLPNVTYASSCWFRGHFVPHLVVRTAAGPVTVMVLPKERVAAPAELDEAGYRGVLVPAPRGSIAVLAHNGGDVEHVASAALAAIAYVD